MARLVVLHFDTVLGPDSLYLSDVPANHGLERLAPRAPHARTAHEPDFVVHALFHATVAQLARNGLVLRQGLDQIAVVTVDLVLAQGPAGVVRNGDAAFQLDVLVGQIGARK